MHYTSIPISREWMLPGIICVCTKLYIRIDIKYLFFHYLNLFFYFFWIKYYVNLVCCFLIYNLFLRCCLKYFFRFCWSFIAYKSQSLYCIKAILPITDHRLYRPRDQENRLFVNYSKYIAFPLTFIGKRRAIQLQNVT